MAYHPDYGIITSEIDVPVMDQEIIGDTFEVLKGLLIVDVNGFFRDIATGHDQGPKGAIHQ